MSLLPDAAEIVALSAEVVRLSELVKRLQAERLEPYEADFIAAFCSERGEREKIGSFSI